MKKISITLAALLVALYAMTQISFWVYNNDGTQTEFLVSEVDGIIFTNNVTDACGNTYLMVKIGKQYWMAENLRCNRYDTQSEAYNASWLTNSTIPTSEKSDNTDTYTPYYIDASDKSKWDSNSKAEYGVNLKDEQIAKLGYLYNWAAAVGVADGEKQTTDFSGNRQGICPNGWHVPSDAEWKTLYDYIYKDKSLKSNKVGKYFKTTSGWYNGDSGYKPGLESYGFAVLPAGSAYGSKVGFVGYEAVFFVPETPSETQSRVAPYYGLRYDKDSFGFSTSLKSVGKSVRCLKD